MLTSNSFSSKDKRIGVNLHKGAVLADDLWFGGFNSTPYYQMGALSVTKCFFQESSIFQKVSNMKFDYSDPVCILHI